MIEAIKSYVKDFMNHPGHPYSHVLRVYRTCEKIAQKYDYIDKEVLLPAALLHDIARAYLESIGFPKDKIGKVASAIRTHRWKTGLEPESVEGRILQDADRIDAIGAVGIIRTVAFNHSIAAYHPTDPLARNRELDDSAYGVDHFFVKLLKIKDRVRTKEIRKEADRRHDYMVFFLSQLEHEVLDADSIGPANLIIRILRENYDKDYYNLGNLSSPDTLFGMIMRYEDDEFVGEFVKELKSEIL